jgi:hypothetical protein
LVPTAWASSKSTLKQSVSPASPIEGFTTFVYDAALEAARERARELGASPDADVVDERDLGPARYELGAPSGLFASMVDVDPMSVVRASGPEARTLSVEGRLSPEGLVEYWYVVRGAGGREVLALRAKRPSRPGGRG